MLIVTQTCFVAVRMHVEITEMSSLVCDTSNITLITKTLDTQSVVL